MRNPLDLLFRPGGRLHHPSTIRTSPSSNNNNDNAAATSSPEQDALLPQQSSNTGVVVGVEKKNEDYRSVGGSHDQEDVEAAAAATTTTTTSTTAVVSFDQACYLIAQVTLTAYSYGGGALPIENALPLLMATTLGGCLNVTDSCFHLTPNAIVLAFAEQLLETAQQQEENQNTTTNSNGNNDDANAVVAVVPQQRVLLLDYPPVTMDMSKLAAVTELVLQLIGHKISVNQTLRGLNDIRAHRHAHATLQFLASSPTIAMGVVPMFQGSWWDLVLAIPLSLLVAVLSLPTTCTAINGDLLPIVAGLLVALMATTVEATLLTAGQVDVYVVTLAAVMTLLPGLSITIGTAELTTRNHTLSGMIAVVQGVVYLIKLGAGAWFGYALVNLLFHQQLQPDQEQQQQYHHHHQPIDPAWIWIMFPIEILGLCAYTLMARRDFAPAFLNCIVGYFASNWAGATAKDKNFGAFVGGALIIMFGNFWSNKTLRPASIVITPVMYYMVASTSAFQGTVEMAQKESEAGKRDFMKMFTTAVMLMAGFIVGNGLVPQKKLTL